VLEDGIRKGAGEIKRCPSTEAQITSRLERITANSYVTGMAANRLLPFILFLSMNMAVSLKV
jgi:hypothetical protein